MMLVCDGQLDAESQSIYKTFNFSNDQSQFMYALRGMLYNIRVNNEISSREVAFFKMWLRSHESKTIDNNLYDLINLVRATILEGVVTENNLIEMKQLVSDSIDKNPSYSKIIQNSINELIGLLLSVLDGGLLKDHQLIHLDHWLSDNFYLKDDWPASVIIDRVAWLRADGVISPEDRSVLLKIIKQLSNMPQISNNFIFSAFSKLNSHFDQTNKRMYFSGMFYTGKRSLCENKASSYGAIVEKEINQYLDVLIVGAITSNEWRSNSFGTANQKADVYGEDVAKAIDYQNQGQELLILSEEQWVGLIN